MPIWEQLTRYQQQGIAILATAIALLALLAALGYIRHRDTVRARQAQQRRAAAVAKTKATGQQMKTTGTHPVITANPTRRINYDRADKAYGKPQHRIKPQPLMTGLSDTETETETETPELDTDEVTAAWLTPLDEQDTPTGEPTGPVEIVDAGARPSARARALPPPGEDQPTTAQNIAATAIATTVEQAEVIGRLRERLDTAGAMIRAQSQRLAVSYTDPMLVRLQLHGQPMTLRQLAAAAGCAPDSSEIRRRIMAAMMFGILRANHDGRGPRDETVRYALADWTGTGRSVFGDDTAAGLAAELLELEEVTR